MIGWNKVCQSKSAGGVGLRKAEVNNVALQLKLLWRLISSDDNMWVQLMKRKYAWNKDIINYKTPIFASWQWKKLLAHRTVFVQGLRWTIGNGQSIKFWSDNWVFQFPLISKFTPTVGSEDLKVSECILESGVWIMVSFSL